MPTPEEINAALASLENRTPRSVKILHVLHGADYHCLDVDVHGESTESLFPLVLAELGKLGIADVLHGADRERWAVFAQLEATRMEHLLSAHTGRTRLLVLIAEEPA